DEQRRRLVEILQTSPSQIKNTNVCLPTLASRPCGSRAGNQKGNAVIAQIATVKKLEVAQPTTEAIEILDAQELAARLKLPKSWILEGTRSRAVDPIPHL